MEEQVIVERIRGLYPDAVIEVNGEDCSFEVYVVTEEFAGINSLQRQQNILALFSEELKTGKLHALGVKAKTPEELVNTPSNLVQISL